MRVLIERHEYRAREGARPIHTAGCPCWRGTSFTLLPEPRSTLWAYLSSPRRSRGRGWPW